MKRYFSWLFQERIRQNSVNSLTEESREVALEEPQNPEIIEQIYEKAVPETQFIVEETDYDKMRNPCGQCVIQ